MVLPALFSLGLLQRPLRTGMATPIDGPVRRDYGIDVHHPVCVHAGDGSRFMGRWGSGAARESERRGGSAARLRRAAEQIEDGEFCEIEQDDPVQKRAA